MSDYVIEMKNITKRFKGIVANDNVTLQLKKGEIHALLGENGAGKSTLMSVLFGLYQAEEGSILLNGKEVKINNPNDANDLGIGMVHQHFKLVDVFTVLENIMLGAETTKKGFLDKKASLEKIMAISNKYNLQINPNSLISDITVGMQQRVEILKMLYRDNDVLIFDEPTAVLTPSEIKELMQIMKNFSKEGKSILFITHKLNEIKEVADRCTILRKGKYIDTVNVSDVSKEDLSRLMVGKDIEIVENKSNVKPGNVILDVKDLSVYSNEEKKDVVNNINFNVKQGEVVCITGIDGNGQSELIYGLTGLAKVSKGTVILNGEDITKSNIRTKFNNGMSHIPEDRHKHGLVLDYSLEYNMVLQKYFTEQFSKFGFLKFKDIEKFSNDLIEKYDIRTSQLAKTPTRSMSGGNQQKVIIAREIDKDPDLLIAVQPTRGLDVGAISFIHSQILKQKEQNKGVLLVSLELEEVMALADRILVMYEGDIVGELDPKETNVEEIGLYMAGAKKQSVVKNNAE